MVKYKGNSKVTLAMDGLVVASRQVLTLLVGGGGVVPHRQQVVYDRPQWGPLKRACLLELGRTGWILCLLAE